MNSLYQGNAGAFVEKLHFCISVFTDSFSPFETFVLMPPIWFVFSMPIELGLNRIPVVKVINILSNPCSFIPSFNCTVKFCYSTSFLDGKC